MKKKALASRRMSSNKVLQTVLSVVRYSVAQVVHCGMGQ